MRVHRVAGRHVVIDPCDGQCNGLHNVTVVGAPVSYAGVGTDQAPATVQAIFAWNGSAFLDAEGASRFIAGIAKAQEIGMHIERHGEYLEE